MMEVRHKDLLRKIDEITKDLAAENSVAKLNNTNLWASKYWYETTYKQNGNCNQVIGGDANLLHRILY